MSDPLQPVDQVERPAKDALAANGAAAAGISFDDGPQQDQIPAPAHENPGALASCAVEETHAAQPSVPKVSSYLRKEKTPAKINSILHEKWAGYNSEHIGYLQYIEGLKRVKDYKNDPNQRIKFSTDGGDIVWGVFNDGGGSYEFIGATKGMMSMFNNTLTEKQCDSIMAVCLARGKTDIKQLIGNEATKERLWFAAQKMNAERGLGVHGIKIPENVYKPSKELVERWNEYAREKGYADYAPVPEAGVRPFSPKVDAAMTNTPESIMTAPKEATPDITAIKPSAGKPTGIKP